MKRFSMSKMNIIDIRTIDQLSIYLNGYGTSQTTDLTDRERAEWFLASHRASVISQLSTKELANMLLDGIHPITGNDEVANKIIQTWFTDYDAAAGAEDPDPIRLDHLAEDAIASFMKALIKHYGYWNSITHSMLKLKSNH